jgi:hypothetical protein
LLPDRSANISWLGEPGAWNFFVDRTVSQGQSCTSTPGGEVGIQGAAGEKASVYRLENGQLGSAIQSPESGYELPPAGSEVFLIAMTETVRQSVAPNQVHLAYVGSSDESFEGGNVLPVPRKQEINAPNDHVALLNTDGPKPVVVASCPEENNG